MSLICSTILLGLAFCLGASSANSAEIRPADDAPKPLTPEESQKRFRLPPGFQIELAASEPMLADPVAMAFDAQGRVFVCEIHGYNLEGHYDVLELNKTGVLDKKVQRIFASEQAQRKAASGTYGTVKLLLDLNGDGKMDHSWVWADRLPACYGVVPARDGVIVLCAPEIIYLADRDGDGSAEIRETLFTGFGVGELWTRINNPQWGVDNWIYGACGATSAGRISGPHLSAPVDLGNTGFRFKADGSAFEPVTGGTSGFGLAFSDWDDRFLISNQQHALYVAPLPHHYLARNPFAPAPNPVINISSYGFPAEIYPTAPPDPWRLKRSQQPEWVKFYGEAEARMNQVTAICAPLIYRADQFPPEFQGNHFSCESAYNLIHRCFLEPTGLSFRAVRAHRQSEFLTSAEQWFRPVNLALGPEGSLYVVDMYREIIEDYTAIPRDLQQQYGLIAGHDKGRIWKVSFGAPVLQRPNLQGASLAQLAGELSSSNAWRRATAQRLLVERGDLSVAPELNALAVKGSSPQARLHALHALNGLGALSSDVVARALHDSHPGIRAQALRLGERWLDSHEPLRKEVFQLGRDPDPKVRLQLAFSLGETKAPEKLDALASLAASDGEQNWMQAAILSSTPDSSGKLLAKLWGEGSNLSRGLIRPLAAVVGARWEIEEVAELLDLIGSEQASIQLRTNALTGLIEGWRRTKKFRLTANHELPQLNALESSQNETVRRLARNFIALASVTERSNQSSAADDPSRPKSTTTKIQDPAALQLLSSYQKALQEKRDVEHGRLLFQEQCLRCHSLNGEGGKIGPDLASTRGRPEETLLQDILFPSEQITAGFTAYIILTLSDDLYTGLVSAETATSLVMPLETGGDEIILRNQIRSITPSTLSLMPDNYAELLKPKDAADLLGYLTDRLGAGAPPVLSLFEDEARFVQLLNEGDGRAEVLKQNPFSGSACLRIEPPQRFSAVIPGWNFRIVEKPGPGQYRYLRFAWKAPDAKGVMLELAASGNWPGPNQALRRYYAGENSTGWAARLVSPDPPKEWTAVTVDLWKDFGEFELTGLAPTAMGGPAWFDQIQLMRAGERGN